MDNVSKGKEKKSFQKEGKNFKKKIIPVVSDSSESSPSPEEPSSPVGSPRSGSLSFRFSNSKMKNQMEIETMKDTLSNSFSKHGSQFSTVDKICFQAFEKEKKGICQRIRTDRPACTIPEHSPTAAKALPMVKLVA